MHREPRVLEPEGQVGNGSTVVRGWITSMELAPLHSVKNGSLQNACSTSPKRDAGLWKSVVMRVARLMMRGKSSTKNGDKSAVAFLKITRQYWAAYFKIWSRRSLHRSCGRAQSDVFDSLIRDQNPSLGMFCLGDPHQRSPNAQKFEDGKSDVPMKQRGGRPKISNN